MEKKILIIGATGGVGEHSSLKLLEAGNFCILVAHNKKKLNLLKKKILKANIKENKFDLMCCDVTNEEEINKLVHDIKNKYIKINYFISAIGAGKVGSIEEVEINDFKKELNLKLLGNISLMKKIPEISSPKECKVIIVSGMFGKVKNYDFIINCTVNAALNSFLKTIAKEYLGKRIKINIINPGAINTPLWDEIVRDIAKIKGISKGKMENEYIDTLPLKELVTVESIFEIINFMFSEKNKFIIGTEIDLDGGSTL